MARLPLSGWIVYFGISVLSIVTRQQRGSILSREQAEVYSFRTVHGMERRTNDLYLREDRVTHLSAA